MSFKRLLKTKPRHRIARRVEGTTLSHTNDDVDETSGLPVLRVNYPVNLSDAAFEFVLKYPFHWAITLWCDTDDGSRFNTTVHTDRCQLNDLTDFIHGHRMVQRLEVEQDHTITRHGWTATNSL